MTGPEHYREAEKALTLSAGIPNGQDDELAAWHQRQAQVHATLALAAAAAMHGGDPQGVAWLEATS